MVSLLELATVTEEGVRFLSPHDGSPMCVFLLSRVLDLLFLTILQASYSGALDFSSEFHWF